MVWQFLKTSNISLTWGPAIPLLCIYLREIKTYVHTETYTQEFTAALFMIAPNWKEPKCPSMDEWINNCGTSYNWVLLSNKKELTYINLKGIMLSEKIFQNVTYYMNHLYNILLDKYVAMETRSLFAKGDVRCGRESVTTRHRGNTEMLLWGRGLMQLFCFLTAVVFT